MSVAIAIVWVLTLPVISKCSSADEKRQLSLEINPGCYKSSVGPGCDTWTNLSLIHIRSDSNDDRLHFIWSFYGAPSLLLARTSLNTNLSINWDAFISGNSSSISFTGDKPYYSFGWSMYKVWMFEDGDDKVRMDKVDQRRVTGYNTKYFKWIRQLNEETSPNKIKLSFLSRKFKNVSIGDDGYFKFTIQVKNSDGYSDILPYMRHNSNSSQIDIEFQKVVMNYPTPNPPTTRVGFALALVQQSESKNESMTLVKIKTLDDEYTPGVFETFSIRTPISKENDQAFLQWKPVCYDAVVRDISDSIDVISYGISSETTDNTSDAISDSIIQAYFGDKLSSILIQFSNISFGSQSDGYYEKTSHISWTYLTGFGSPPQDYVSLLVKLVVAIGLGVPSVIIISSGLYVLINRVSKPKDDLILGR